MPDTLTQLIDQFLQGVSNTREDAYGGSLDNRFKFPLAVVDAVCAAIGAERVGVRISPFGRFQSMREAAPLDTFVPFTQAVITAQPRLAYIHALEPRADGGGDMAEVVAQDDLGLIRDVVSASSVRFLVTGAYGVESAKKATTGSDDLVGFGRHFICKSRLAPLLTAANPDLVQRITHDWPLAPYHRPTFYTGGKNGYTECVARGPLTAVIRCIRRVESDEDELRVMRMLRVIEN